MPPVGFGHTKYDETRTVPSATPYETGRLIDYRFKGRVVGRAGGESRLSVQLWRSALRNLKDGPRGTW